MNRLLLLIASAFLLAFPFLSSASHMAGNRITYECIAPDQYRVSMIVYRDCSGANFNRSTVSIAFYNNCDSKADCPDGTFTAYRTPGTGLPVNDECVDLPPTTCFGGTRFGLEAYEFEGIFEVPRGTKNDCQDWWFYWQDAICCRNPSVTLAAFGTPFVSAYLNNRHEVNPCNNSSLADIPYVPAFCPNQPVTLKFNYTDPDGDSLVVSWQRATRQPRPGTPPCFGDSIPYASPYTPYSPGSSSTAWNLNPFSGNISWTPTNVQTVVLVTKVEEWRGTTLVGWTWMDLQVRIDIDPIICTQLKVPTYEQDTLYQTCGDSILRFDLSTNVHCSTVSPNASEWRLYSSQTGRAVQIDSCWILNCNVLTNVSPELMVETFEPLLENGNYYLYPKKGDDGNTFGNQCGKDMKEFDTLVVNISGCYEFKDPPLLTNVSVEPINNEDFIIEWEESSTIDPDFFSAYVLYAAENPLNESWKEIKRFNTLSDKIYLHDNPSRLPINGSMHYVLQLEYKLLNSSGLNFKKLTPFSNKIASIHCVNYPSQSDPEDELFELSWNEYEGWASVVYEVEYSEENPRNWTFDGSTTQEEYTLKKPLEKGEYLARCYSDNLLPSGDLLRAYSNWIPLKVPKRVLTIPNIITPNNDGKNDFLNIKNIEFYPNTAVLVYNRWGNEVYSTSDYTNDKDSAFGDKVKTGVYYWVLKLQDSDELKGTIKVIE